MRRTMEFDPVILRYDGLDADRHLVDLGQVAVSLQGAAQLIGSAGSAIMTGQYARRAPALSIRVYAGIPRDGCWELPAIIAPVAPVAGIMFPQIAEIGKRAATKAVTAAVNYVVAKVSGQSNDVKRTLDSLDKAVSELGQTARHGYDALERMAAQQRPAARNLVVPIGQSCRVIYVGNMDDGAIAIDSSVRSAIDAPEPVEIIETSSYEIFISELDTKNRTCKFSLHDDDPEHRLIGEITDPVIQAAHNPYLEAFAAQRWIVVLGKAQIKDGEMEKLFISDVTSPKLLTG
jgi:hypothetical protein